ncbi:MAG: hypothetical protein JXB00_19505 [Bacteroidales bacterium]|nr:hypothetical protein [Bacteroidales bacterium]
MKTYLKYGLQTLSGKILYYFISIILFMQLLSCEKDDDNNYPELINRFHPKYMHYPSLIPLQNYEDNLVDLVYVNQKIVKRIGVAAALPFGYTLNKNFYDTLIYTNNNRINIIQKENNHSGEDRSYNDRIVILDSKGRISKKLYDNSSTANRVDTVHYYFDNRNLIIKSTQREYFYQSESHFFYNSKLNLDSIVTITVNDNGFSYKEIETFSNYDNSENPLKHLIIFDELFKRALSNNNYQKYTYDSYDYEGNISSYAIRTWELPHDENGKVVFDE